MGLLWSDSFEDGDPVDWSSNVRTRAHTLQIKLLPDRIIASCECGEWAGYEGGTHMTHEDAADAYDAHLLDLGLPREWFEKFRSPDW